MQKCGGLGGAGDGWQLGWSEEDQRESAEEASSGPVAVREGEESRPMHVSQLGYQAGGGIILEERDPERTVGKGVEEKWVWVPLETSLEAEVPRGRGGETSE